MERIVIKTKDLKKYPISRKEFNQAIGNRKWIKGTSDEEKERLTAIINTIPKDKLKVATKRTLTDEWKANIKNGLKFGNTFKTKISNTELELLGYSREEFEEIVKKSAEFTLDENLLQEELIDITNYGGLMSGIKNDIFKSYAIKYRMHGDCIRDFAFERKNGSKNRKGQFINVIFKASDNWETPVILKSTNFLDEIYENIFVEIAKELLNEKLTALEAC